MTKTLRQYASNGFTLIELLIVVIIIAILAAIAIPQFGNSTAEATDAALDANLTTVRSAIELYRAQHNNSYPGLVATTVAAGCPANSGAVASGANLGATFISQMTMYSNRAGQICGVPLAGLNFGPYLREMPRDPVTGDGEGGSDVLVGAAAFIAAPDAAAPGWRFSTANGRFEMNSTAPDRNGNPYWNH